LVGKAGLNVDKQGMIKGAFFVEIGKKNLRGRKNDIHVEVWSGNKKIDGMKTNFNYK
jgi:hypothetical protein